MTWEYLLATVIVIASPGTGAFYCLSTALSRGRRAGWIAALACAIATVPHAVLAITGIAAVLTANGTLYRVLTYAGALFLVWMAYGMWTDNSALAGGNVAPRTLVTTLRDAVVMNLLNPKLTLFFVAFLPQFVPASAHAATARLSLLALVFMLLTFAVYGGYVIAADRLRSRIASRPTVLHTIRRGFALVFVGLGAYVVLSA